MMKPMMLAVVMVLTPVLGACGGGETPKTADDAEASEPKQTPAAEPSEGSEPAGASEESKEGSEPAGEGEHDHGDHEH